MAVPLRDDGRPGPTKRLIVFVHGFMSSSATWAPLKRLLQEDDSVAAEFDLHQFDYETAAGAMPVVNRLPTLDEAGKSFVAELQATLLAADGSDRYIDVTLVGHSMGGLIIQSGILELLTPGGSTRVLEQIRQGILFATPNFGSTTLGRVRSLLGTFVDNPQERALRLFSEDGTRIHEGIRDRVIFARRRARDEYPIPFYCFWGRTDAVVRAESALGHFPAGEPLPGDHFSVHCPENREAPAYRQFVDTLRRPQGHPNVWEVEQLAMSIGVSPLAADTAVTARYGVKERTVVCDNSARVVRKASFSTHNRCRAPYVLKYGTRNGGWVVPLMSEPHVTPPDKLRLYDDNGCDAYYEVDPAPGSTACLSLTVYKGFDEGQRDFHMHLGRSSYYRRVRIGVDLSAYRTAGWNIVEPRVYFHPTDPGDHALCAHRTMIHPDPPEQVDAAGVWTWDLEYVSEGVLDVVWDVVAPAAAGAPEETIRLAPGEHAIFGYGSLLSIASLERTLGRSYKGPFRVCAIRGWRRRWNVAMPNETFIYRDGDRWITPNRIFYLNVEPDPAVTLNGILFVVSADELARFDKREWIYDRVDVSAVLEGVRIEGGSAWVYQGKPAYVSAHPLTAEDGAIRKTYLDILDAGHRALGADFVRVYNASTDPVPPSLVVDDLRRDDMSLA